uniref:Uncharacterized protein n=1 Tax=Anguilla anguilla TaxID=7936 RepID=A0A0E9WRF3_ANGAN
MQHMAVFQVISGIPWSVSVFKRTVLRMWVHRKTGGCTCSLCIEGT